MTIEIKKAYARDVIDDLQSMGAIDVLEYQEEKKLNMLAWVRRNRKNAPKIDPSIDIRALIDATHDREI